ncbi:MAG: hydroxymethylbilane synthase [Burkholderiaceae bacterium]
MSAEAALQDAPARLVLASRESRLAMWQAEHVRDRLKALYPSCEIEILGLTTEGDRVLDRPLAEIGGKGLFIKELEVALADGRADLAVHSMKDVPMQMPPGFSIGAILAREDPRDAFVSNHHESLQALPPGARLGTSSLRRSAQLLALHPRLEIRPLRGNINTRMRKLDDGEYDAIILAAAGLKRLGFAGRIRQIIPPPDCLPAVGQGALAIEIRADRADLFAWLAPLNHRATELAVTCERSMAGRLAGSCRVPLAGYCESIDGGLHELRARVAAPDGSEVLESVVRERLTDPGAASRIGLAAAEDLLAQGAARWLPLS